MTTVEPSEPTTLFRDGVIGALSEAADHIDAVRNALDGLRGAFTGLGCGYIKGEIHDTTMDLERVSMHVHRIIHSVHRADLSALEE